MAYKTMLRQLIGKWGILSVDLQQAIESDTADDKFAPESSNMVIEMEKPMPEPQSQDNDINDDDVLNDFYAGAEQ